MFLTPIFGEKQNKTKKIQTPITKPIKKTPKSQTEKCNSTLSSHQAKWEVDW